MPSPESEEIQRLRARVVELEAELARARSGSEGFPAQFEGARLLFDAVPIPSAYIDKDYTYRFANRAYLELFGLSSSQLIGRTVQQSLGPEAFEAVRPHLERVLSGHVVIQQKYVPYPPERGGTRLVEAALVPDKRRDGSTAGYLGLMIDGTPRYRAEQALRESEERYRRLVELAPYGIVVHEGGRVAYVNAMAKRIFGIEADVDLTGQPVMDFVHPDCRAVVIERIRGLLDDQSEVPAIEEVFLRSDGRPIRVETRGISVTWQGRRAVQTTFHDVTLRREQEEALRLTSERLAEQSRDLEQRVAAQTKELREKVAELELFAYSVSHDLRAPLRAMNGLACALVDDHAENLGVEGAEFARRIMDASTRLDALMRDLLEYSRISCVDLPLENVTLEAVIDRALDRLEADIDARRAVVLVRRPLPRIVGHAGTLEVVVRHLVDNALKFMPAGLPPRVEIEAHEIDGRARVWIIDHGIGIDPEHHDRIFNVFERLHAGSAYAGTGIGLAIVRKAVDRMGGKAGVVSSPGHGSRFWVELPVAS